jgi:hypothetical protein
MNYRKAKRIGILVVIIYIPGRVGYAVFSRNCPYPDANTSTGNGYTETPITNDATSFPANKYINTTDATIHSNVNGD